VTREYDPIGDDGLLQPAPPPRWYVIVIAAAAVTSPVLAGIALWLARRR
jgi:hypothetical protein